MSRHFTAATQMTCESESSNEVAKIWQGVVSTRHGVDLVAAGKSVCRSSPRMGGCKIEALLGRVE